MLPDRVHPILLLEDEPDDASFVRRALQKNAIVNELIVCRTTAEAKDVIANARADRLLPVLAICDVFLLNGETGLKFLEWLRREAPPASGIPAMMYSVSADDEHRRQASVLRSVVFLAKPATEESLGAAVQRLGFVVTTTAAGGRVQRVIEPR